MRRIVVAFVGAGIMSASAVGGALAEQPTGLEPNPHQNAAASENCVGLFSAQVIHNGLVVRNQDRQAEVKALQEECNNASDKDDE